MQKLRGELCLVFKIDSACPTFKGSSGNFVLALKVALLKAWF